MSVLIIVPARFASTRFEGKPLVLLKGAKGQDKSLIQRSWEAACVIEGARVVVATDDLRIKSAAEGFGAEVVMTSSKVRNGTERCAEVIDILDKEFEIIVNLQGDAPLTPPWFVSDIIEALQKTPDADMTTPVLLCDDETLLAFKNDRANGRVGGTTAVFDNTGKALYFSKEIIPYAHNENSKVYHHVGVYAYRPESLRAYAASPEALIERQEGLEQLRFLALGRHIQCVKVEAKGRAFWEVNNPQDIERVEMILKKLDIA